MPYRYIYRKPTHRHTKRRKTARKKWYQHSTGRYPIKRYMLSDAPLNYDQYLAGPYWQSLRREMLGNDSRCKDCGGAAHLQLHHRYYYKDGKSVLYRERSHADLLVVLCHSCHMQRHRTAEVS